MTLKFFSNIIKTTCIQITNTIIMNIIVEKFLPPLLKLLKYLNYLGLIKILIYFLCISVLVYIIFKFFKLLKIFKKRFGSEFNLHSNSLTKCNNSSTLLFNKNFKINKNIKSDEISSIESKSSDFNLGSCTKIIHKIASSKSNNKKNKKSTNREKLLDSFS